MNKGSKGLGLYDNLDLSASQNDQELLDVYKKWASIYDKDNDDLLGTVSQPNSVQIFHKYLSDKNQKIIDVVNRNNGKAVFTSIGHQTGTDRVFEVFKDHLNSEPNLIVNLQGDMPNIESQAISERGNDRRIYWWKRNSSCNHG